MSERLNEAINYAVKVYDGLVRRRDSLPYILHPLETVTIASTLTPDEDVLIAALLHDTIEDCGITAEEIEKRFGTRVMKLVLSETEEKYPGERSEDTWIRRKEESIQLLIHAEDFGTQCMWLADKLSNTRSFYRAFLAEGMGFVNFLHMQDIKKLYWYYDTVRKNLPYCEGSQALEEYSRYVDLLFGTAAERDETEK